MGNTSHRQTSELAKQHNREYLRNYFRTHPEIARKNQADNYARYQRDQSASVKQAYNNRQPWEPDDDEYLAEMYPDHTQKEIAYAMGRTVRSVGKRVKILGLRKNAPRATD